MIRALTVVLLLCSCMLVASDCQQLTRANCPQHPNCRVVLDADADGEIADDLRRARNELLYSGGPPPARVFLYPPDPGTYTWTGEVRLCGDATNLPTGEAEPSCDGTGAIPVVHFKGDWTQTPFDADCADGDESGSLAACLRVGDRMLGDGVGEPRPTVLMDSRMVFRHVTSLPTYAKYVFAVWADGVDGSRISIDVRGDAGLPDDEITFAGAGVYGSATNSVLAVRALPGSGKAPLFMVLADGAMDGTQIDVTADFSQVIGRPYSALTVGTVELFGPAGLGPGCDYGPDVEGTCSHFDANVAFHSAPGFVGSQVIDVVDGDDIDLAVDIDDLEYQHNTIKIDGSGVGGSGGPPQVGTVRISGYILHDHQGTSPAIAVNKSTNLYLDALIETVDFEPCYLAAPTATVTLGPNFQCIHDVQ